MSNKFKRDRSQLQEAMASQMAYFTRERRVESEDQLLDIKLLDPFPNQPYRVVMDEAMQELISSIEDTGLIQPIIVRQSPTNPDRYQIISGHRRVYACKHIGYRQIKAVVKEMDDDAAIMYLIDSNKYRPELLASEKAYAYKMRMAAMKRRAGRPSKNVSQVETNKRTSEVIAEEMGDSRAQVDRYIRLTELIPELMEAVDVKKLKMRPAVELSYLPKNDQETIYRSVIAEGRSLTYEQAKKLRETSQAGMKITTTEAECASDMPNEDKIRKRLKLTIRIKKMLPKEIQKNIVEQEEYIAECIRFYQEHQKVD